MDEVTAGVDVTKGGLVAWVLLQVGLEHGYRAFEVPPQVLLKGALEEVAVFLQVPKVLLLAEQLVDPHRL